tara:strand:+ start:64163 stop:67096 length:2934 start_codon:yes stop_codon:yes gene_type:complete
MSIYRVDVIPKEPRLIYENQLFKEFAKDEEANVYRSKVYWIEVDEKLDRCDLNYMANEILADSLIENVFTENSKINYTFNQFVEVSFKPGVRDNRAQATLDAIKISYPDLKINIYTGDGYFFDSDSDLNTIKSFTNNYLCNPLLNNINIYLKHDFENNRFTKNKISKVELHKSKTEYINLSLLNDEELIKLSDSRCLALSLAEMKQIQNYIKNRSATNEPLISDVELEILAQTWSEHCKHKIFAAQIDYSEKSHNFKAFPNQSINSLYKEFIKKSTNNIKKEKTWLRSVFSDNAGVVRFDDKFDLCIKVETHNSPCALDPYGGALTGILGVNRDIMGTGLGAQTIANMDVFCTGFPKQEYPLPPKLMQPSRILKEVHKGVEDGGNKSGIPTINGSMHFHDNWVGKPLIYVGSVGIIPHKLKNSTLDPVSKNQKAGDLIVICGGRVGADGIHGATFSSMELKDDALSTFVQIGDPYTQKKVADFLIKARDLNLYTSITDNGAGGLSSSIGEMAEKAGGANIYLDRALLKYPGLKNYEIMISESQERMSISVEKEKFQQLQELAKTFEVEIVNMGEFTDSGKLKVYDGNELCADLDLDFMHNGLEQLKLKASFDPDKIKLSPWIEPQKKQLHDDLNQLCQAVLAHPNIASKEEWVRQYDHEVKAQSVLKPYNGKNQKAPSDAGVIDLSIHGASSLISISNGLDTLHSQHDTYISAHYAIDEAIRNLLATGADIEHMALLDNFCWPDPIKSPKNLDGEHKLALLVRANFALKEACENYSTPLISGKDSMKNDFYGNDINGEKIKISSPPTLLVTGMSKNKKLIKNHFQTADQLVYQVGAIDKEVYRSHLSEIFDIDSKGVHPFSIEKNKELYSLFSELHPLISACHDISEGGLFATLFEMTLGDNIGVEITESLSLGYLFNEPLGNFVMTIDKNNQEKFEKILNEIPFKLIGHTTSMHQFKIANQVLDYDLLLSAYQGAF